MPIHKTSINLLSSHNNPVRKILFFPGSCNEEIEVQKVRGHTASSGQCQPLCMSCLSHLQTCLLILNSTPSDTYYYFVLLSSNYCIKCKSAHVTLLLKNLQWLPIDLRTKSLTYRPFDISPYLPLLPHVLHAICSSHTKLLAFP